MKKNNYKFNIDSERLSSEQVEKHKDFDALMSQFEVEATEKEEKKAVVVQMQPQRNRKWVKWAAAAAAIMAGVFFFYNSTQPTGLTTKQYLAQKAYIDPPLKNVKAQFASYKVDGSQGGQIEYNENSVLNIPENAFVHKSGNEVKGEVDIRYREFHDFVDFFLSGIPMEYDSAGQRYILESSGMIEIYAEQGGERLDLSPGKSIEIELHSEIKIRKNESPKYNVYKLDTKARNWTYQGVDRLEILPVNQPKKNAHSGSQKLAKQFNGRISDIEKKKDNDLAKIEATLPMPNAPTKPQRRNGTDMSFELDFEEIEFADSEASDESLAEMRKYGNMVWQVAPGETLNDAVGAIEWDDYKMQKLSVRDYELTLIKDAQMLKLKVNPVLTGDAYNEAMAGYNAALAKYNQLLTERSAQLQSQKDVVVQDFEKQKAAIQESYDNQLKAIQQQANSNIPKAEFVNRKVINRFKASSLGIWNCDRPVSPQAIAVKAKFVDNKNKKHDKSTAWLVNKNRNTIMRHYTNDNAKLEYELNGDNLLWVLTEDDKIAIYLPEEFKSINKKNTDHTFVMKVIDKQLGSEDNVRKILHF